MYMNKPHLRGEGEVIKYTQEQIEEYVRCANDIIYFAEKYFYIVDLDEGRKSITLYDYQKRMLKIFQAPPNNKQHVIALLPRQMGKTTTTSIYILHYILFNEDKNVFVIANKESAAKEVLRRIQLAFVELPLWLQSGIVKWGAEAVHLENGCRLNAASTSAGSISGQSVNLLYIDEFSKIPNNLADDFIASTFPVISSGNSSQIIITQTPFGLNHGFRYWSDAVKGKSRFYPIKVRWEENPKRDKLFKKNMIADIGLLLWNQEFECKFSGSTETLIDQEVLEQQPVMAPINTLLGDKLKVYELPIAGQRYIAGVDVCGGLGGQDNSTIVVLKELSHQKLVQVASYRYNSIQQPEFAQVCVTVGKYYNDAMLIVENNLGGEEVANDIYYSYEYENIYSNDPRKFGVRATTKTKLAAVLNMQRYFLNSWVFVTCLDTHKELSVYGRTKRGNFGALGEHQTDDLVSALYWALYYYITPEFKQEIDPIRPIEDRFKIQSNIIQEDENASPPSFYFSV